MKRIKIYSILLLTIFFWSACVNDLDTIPLDDDSLSGEQVYSSFEGYKQVMAKCYAGLALTGQTGAAGNGDLAGIDEGVSSYIRGYWHLQVLPSEEAIVAWEDVGVPDFHAMNWVASNTVIQGLFYRIKYQVTICNEMIRECNKAESRGYSGTDLEQINFFKAEARLLRALSYYHGIDLFGNLPFCLEDDPIGGDVLPPYYTRQEIYEWLEPELLDLVDDLPESLTNEAGRVDQAAAWLILTKLYANAEVYIGTAQWDECAEYAKKVIDSGYTLETSYEHLFLADNHTASGVLLSVYADGAYAQSFGSTTFILSGSIGGDMVSTDYGTQNAWAGNRATLPLAELFDITFSEVTEGEETDIDDKRAMFYRQTGQTGEITTISEFTEGVHVVKFKNLNQDGSVGSRLDFPDIDFPLLRVAEAHLYYAEAYLNGASETTEAEALGYVNEVRERAYESTAGNITASELTLDWILDERAREFYWEGYRRTDLIRHNKWVAGYSWPWKAGVAEGQDSEDFRTIYPLPTSEITANPNLVQNPGY